MKQEKEFKVCPICGDAHSKTLKKCVNPKCKNNKTGLFSDALD